MGTTQRATPQRPYDRGRLIAEQLRWIEARDRVGVLIDRYLASSPPREMRAAIAELEQSLRAGDEAARLA